MVKMPSRAIQAEPDEVIRGNRAYPKSVGALPVIATINPSDYALIQEGDEANAAISMAQRFNGLQFFPMLQEAMKAREVLATLRPFIRTLLNVNAARREEGVIYDALGNLIEGDRLIQYANLLNHDCWTYLNARFPQGQGFRGLDIVTAGASGIETRAPLEPCLEENCYAELDSMNNQGLLTKKASVQKYEPGKVVLNYPPRLRADKPEEGYVAGFGAYSDWAVLYCGGDPDGSLPSLGGFACAEGAAQK
jgi:hypothetical protein